MKNILNSFCIYALIWSHLKCRNRINTLTCSYFIHIKKCYTEMKNELLLCNNLDDSCKNDKKEKGIRHILLQNSTHITFKNGPN